ncbi:MAG: Gfo/Idh/MocA family oxidoreductase [Verrucomicrobia bacterium]|nr:Gfo/Idh/MocA family oxidoreductase [Verrucomicrobiota bacterium]
MNSRIRVAIMGAGRIAELHLHGYRLLASKVDIPALVDVQLDIAQQKADRWQIPKAFRSLDELFSQEQIDAVDICLPHNIHVDAVQQAAANGKHIFIEKPLARTLVEADTILSAAREAKIKLMVAHNHIFNELIEKVQKCIVAGLIGSVHLIKAHSLSWFLFTPNDFRKSLEQNGGGAFIDTGAHFVYVLQHLFGAVVEVTAMFGQSARGEMEGEETGIVLLHFAEGCIAEITISYSTRLPGWEIGFPSGWDQTVYLLGDKGAIRISLAQEKFWIYSKDVPLNGELQGWTLVQMPGSYARSYDREVASFVEVLTNGGQPKVSGEDARRTLEVIESAHRSAQTRSSIAI